MDHAQRAKTLFVEGYNCAQAVFMAFCEDRLGTKEAARLASCFGGGVGGMRGMCGALSGMLMAYGLLRGYDDPADRTVKAEQYVTVQALAARFKVENGSTVCRELLGLDENDCPRPPQARTPGYYASRPCPELVASAAQILDAYLAENTAEDAQNPA